MNNASAIIPPHLNAEVYRSDTTYSSSPYLDFIKIHSDGDVLLGCSELTGRYWDGSVSVFKGIEEATQLHKEEKKNIELKTGTPDGCFVQSSSKVILCEDSGAVSIWSFRQDLWKMWSEDVSVREHNNAVLGVDCLGPSNDYVTVGADGNAKVWDINEMICMRNYADAHCSVIYGVATRPSSTNSFATASQDHYVSLWDDLVTKPVMDVVKNDHAVRCVQWLDDNRIVFGDEEGLVKLIDIRNADTSTTLATFPAAVHKIVVHKQKDKLGVCCDNKIVSVCKIGGDGCATVIYSDTTTHRNYVRGLAWDHRHTDTLHSIGWDGELQTHCMK